MYGPPLCPGENEVAVPCQGAYLSCSWRLSPGWRVRWMAHTRGSQFRRSSGPKRKTNWLSGPLGSVGATAASSSLFATAIQLTVPGRTLIRTRGELNVALSVITSALDGFGAVAFGLAIVELNAFNVGITAMPKPFSDSDWDGWFWHWQGSLFGPSATVTNAGGPANVRIPIDSKAMRKWKQFDVMVAIMEVATEVGAAVLTAKLNTRILVKLP